MAMKIIFAGTPEFAAVSLMDLVNSKHDICAVYTQPDRPAGRGQKLTASAVKQLALQYNLPVFQPASLKSLEEQARLGACNADVMLIAAYGLILPKKVLAIPRYGCINIHASWLPRWRGAAPIQRAILAGDRETGISIMQMDEGLDTGDLLSTHRCEINSTDTTVSLLKKLAKLGSKAMLATLDDLQRNYLTHTPQDPQFITYAAKITKTEAEINWQEQSVFEIDRLIRAFNPWPVAYTYLNGITLRIWQARLVAAEACGEPGTIVAISKQGIHVACHDGILCLTEIQWPNTKRQGVEQNLLSQQKIFKIGLKLAN